MSEMKEIIWGGIITSAHFFSKCLVDDLKTKYI